MTFIPFNNTQSPTIKYSISNCRHSNNKKTSKSNGCWRFGGSYETWTWQLLHLFINTLYFL